MFFRNPEKINFADIKPEAMLDCCTTDYLLRCIFMQVFSSRVGVFLTLLSRPKNRPLLFNCRPYKRKGLKTIHTIFLKNHQICRMFAFEVWCWAVVQWIISWRIFSCKLLVVRIWSWWSFFDYLLFFNNFVNFSWKLLPGFYFYF